MHQWGTWVGRIGAGLIYVGIVLFCTAFALVGAMATVNAWRWFRLCVGF